MSFIKDLVSGGVEGVLSAAGSFAKDLREAITGKSILSAEKQAELLLKAQELEAAQEKALLDYQQKMSESQNAVNQEEAKNPSLFVSGWRPCIGWICASGLAYAFILKPLLPWLITSIALVFGHTVVLVALPVIELGELLTLLMGMLGLGGLRTYEKTKGVNRK